MNRREFLNKLAMVAAGVAVLPALPVKADEVRPTIELVDSGNSYLWNGADDGSVYGDLQVVSCRGVTIDATILNSRGGGIYSNYGQFESLTEAIDAVQEGEILTVKAGTYRL